jgi:hypothetical protein
MTPVLRSSAGREQAERPSAEQRDRDMAAGSGAFLSFASGPTGGLARRRGMVFFVVRRSQDRKVRVTAGDIFAFRPGVGAGHAGFPGGAAATPLPRSEAGPGREMS